MEIVQIVMYIQKCVHNGMGNRKQKVIVDLVVVAAVMMGYL